MLLVKYNISYNNIVMLGIFLYGFVGILFVIIENMKGKIFLFKRIINSYKMFMYLLWWFLNMLNFIKL